MNYSDWLRKILAIPLMLPAYAHVAIMLVRERSRHALRRRLGDSANRAQCCGPMCTIYPLGQAVKEIPELATKLEQVSELNFGYTRWFSCRACGQEWREDFESVGNHSEDPHVRKAT